MLKLISEFGGIILSSSINTFSKIIFLSSLTPKILIRGTNIGQDTKTQITTVVSGAQISLNRTVGQGATLNIDSDNSYTVILEQDGVMNEVRVNGGSDSTISIRQGSG